MGKELNTLIPFRIQFQFFNLGLFYMLSLDFCLVNSNFVLPIWGTHFLLLLFVILSLMMRICKLGNHFCFRSHQLVLIHASQCVQRCKLSLLWGRATPFLTQKVDSLPQTLISATQSDLGNWVLTGTSFTQWKILWAANLPLLKLDWNVLFINHFGNPRYWTMLNYVFQKAHNLLICFS